MRALLISPSSVPGGAERAFASLARRLPEHGIDCHVVLLQPGPLEQWLSDAGCETEVIDAGRTRQLHRTASTISALAQRARDADVVLSNQSKGHVYGNLAARITGKPAVWWQQGTPTQSRIETVAAAIPPAAVIVSSRLALDAQRKITPRARIAVIHLGIDLSAVRSARGSGSSIRKRHGWHDSTLVGIVGRLQPWKGQDDFLRAAAVVAHRHPNVHFVVIGGAVLGWEGTYQAELESLARDLGIDERVSFVGHQDDVYPWFDALDVVVHASHGEPFGLVLVEAMALGKPLVATAVGGPAEIVEDGVSGFLVPPRDDREMAKAVSALLEDEDLRDRIGAAAKVRSELFDERRMAGSVADLLRNVARARPDESRSEISPPLTERSVPGLHQYVYDTVIASVPAGATLDLGAGSGAFAKRLVSRGHSVLAADRDAIGFEADVPFVDLDLNQPNWSDQLRQQDWSLITAIEVIEHLENPIDFLRNIHKLLAADGRAVITTPNVDSLPARLKFLFRDRLRMLDEWGDPTHITPIFWDLLCRKYLPLAGLALVDADTYPPDGFVVGRPAYQRLQKALKPVLSKGRLVGDNHILVLARAEAAPETGGARP